MPTTFIDGQKLTGPALTAALAQATADAAGSSPVTSVAGRVGTIVLSVADVSGAYPSANPAGYITAVSPALSGTPTAPTSAPGDNDTSIATTAFVQAAVVAATTGVATFNGRTGGVTLSSGDVTTALTFTPQTAAQVSTAVATETTRATTAEALLAPKASPTFTGTPAAPTVPTAAAAGTTQIATTAFVRNGTTTNDNALSGQVGEYLSTTVLIGAAVSLVNNTAKDVATLTLTAGDWDVWGNVAFVTAGSTNIAQGIAWTSTTANTAPVTPNNGAEGSWVGSVAGATVIVQAGRQRLSLATTTTVSLGAFATFSVSTLTAYGFIGARRVR